MWQLYKYYKRDFAAFDYEAKSYFLLLGEEEGRHLADSFDKDLRQRRGKIVPKVVDVRDLMSNNLVEEDEY